MVSNRLVLTIAALAAIPFAASVSLAAKGKTEVTTDQLINVTAPFGKKDKNAVCLENTPGSVKDKGGTLIFTPFTIKIRKLKKKSLTNPKVLPKLKKWRKFNKKAKKACKEARENPGATPTPTPPTGPTPTPSPIPVFDANGNVTAEGKVFLGIPVNLDANIDAGEIAHNFHGCASHHAERTTWHYPQLESRIEQDPMFLLVPENVSYQELADITAYLNRFLTGIP